MRITENLKKLQSYFSDPLYIVGGYVRNTICFGDYTGTDIDICGAYTPEEVEKILAGTDIKVVPVNPRIGTLKITVGEESYEYTCFREDSYAEGGEHTPVSVSFVKDIKLDALRRDFTVNAVYFDIKNEKLVDPTDGIVDIDAKVLRTVAKPEKVFEEDGLRIMRLARFAAELGFSIEERTLEVAKQLCKNLKNISGERIRMELDRILASNEKYGNKEGVRTGLTLLSDLDAWQYVIPEFGVNKNNALFRGIDAAASAHPSVRLAALIHCISESVKDFEDHEKTAKDSAELSRVVLGHELGLKYKEMVRSEVYHLVLASGFHRCKGKSVEEIKLFVQENFVYMDKILLLIKALEGGETPNIQAIEREYQFMKENNVPYKISDLVLRGADVIALGVPPIRIGEVLQTILKRSALSGKRFSREEELAIAESLKC